MKVYWFNKTQVMGFEIVILEKETAEPILAH